jgi:electron transport complex protein RnfB
MNLIASVSPEIACLDPERRKLELALLVAFRRAYAEAIAGGEAINRCPPGGAEGIVRLARITHRPVQPLDPACGSEGPRSVALIDEAWCIGCTLCLDACPVDAILGAHKRMHTVIADACNGCELCLPACPVGAIFTADGAPAAPVAWTEANALWFRDRDAARAIVNRLAP